jgi:hypothetical protein
VCSPGGINPGHRGAELDKASFFIAVYRVIDVTGKYPGKCLTLLYEIAQGIDIFVCFLQIHGSHLLINIVVHDNDPFPAL